MELQIYQVDAFSRRVFGGNPAAIVLLDAWPDDVTLQSIAMENNLSETAYLVPEPADAEADFALRWFTPTVEVDLCGHATFASAWLLFHELGYEADSIAFNSRSGILKSTRKDGQVVIDLPARDSVEIDCPAALATGLKIQPQSVRSGANLIAIFENESQIAGLEPDFRALAELHPQGVIVTAPGDNVDVVSRFFGPSFGIDEDPVTGSAHADLAPYWTERLGRQKFSAQQISARVGELEVEQLNDRVNLSGQGQLYLKGVIRI